MRHLIVPLDNVPSMAGGREAIRTSVVEVGYSPSGTRRLDRRRVASPKCGKLSVSRLPTNQTLPPYRAQQWSSNRGRTIEGSGNPAQKYYMRQPKQNELFFGPKYKRIEKPLITNDDVCEDNKINTALPGRHQKLVTRQGQRIYFEDSIKSRYKERFFIHNHIDNRPLDRNGNMPKNGNRSLHRELYCCSFISPQGRVINDALTNTTRLQNRLPTIS